MLTFLFTDVEGSTRLWEAFPDAMKAAMDRHDAVLRNAVEGSRGRVVKTTGDGLMAVFPSPSDGVTACLRGQRGLRDEPWGEPGAVRVRMGMHTGEAQARANDYFGPPVNRAARIAAAAHGGQVLLSAVTAGLAGRGTPPGVGFRDLGEHRLKDLLTPERLYQLVHPEIVSDFPPPSTLTLRRNNLPTQVSEFLGRETELDAISRLLAAAGVRLLTITGPGGIGKTRLGLQAAAEQIDRFQDGVYFVELSSVWEPDAAFDAVVRALEVTGARDEEPLRVLQRQLTTRHLLLLLDNFEQVIDAADGVVELLQHCPALKVVVTSRESLRVRGEQLFPVPPMSLPESGRDGSAEAVGAAESVRLFLERAHEAGLSLQLTDENAADVAEICARLDGLPLAIELAAARLRVFSPPELRDRLRRRLDLLRGGPRDLPARQQTLRDTIAWSYELLDTGERALLGVLSVFSPTRVEAVEEVASRLDPLRGVDAIEGLASLVDKSLVRRVDDAGRRRFSLLETIREYAAERLDDDPGLRLAARAAHAGYFARFASDRREDLHGPARQRTLDDLESELGNLTAAWRHWLAAGELDRLEQLFDGLWALHEDRGWYRAAVELTRELLGVLSASPASPGRDRKEIQLQTSLARGLLAISGFTEEVEQAYGRALELTEQAADLPMRFPVLRSLASFHLFRGEFGRAAALGRELLELAERERDAGLQVEGHLLLGSSTAFLGDLGTGLGHLDRAIDRFRPDQHGREHFRLGPNPGVVSHTTSALLLWLAGHPDRATARATAAVDLARQLKHPFTLAYTMFHVGVFHLWRPAWSLVAERASDVLEVANDYDYQVWKALALLLQGVAAAGSGRPQEGLALVDDGIARYQGLTTPPVFWPLVLYVRATTCGLADRPADARTLIDEAIELAGTGILYPEFALLRGDLLLASGDAHGAAVAWRSAGEVAETWGLRLPELRAATRLARTGTMADAVTELGRLYRAFTEGLQTPDLMAARAVLDAGDTPVA